MYFCRCPQKFKTSANANDAPFVNQISEIVGGSIAGLGLVIFTMVVTIYCWKKGKCPCCKNSTVVEENEMYGAPQDYDEYDKDDYDTKVIDDNYMYYE